MARDNLITILLVEDNPADSRLIADSLKHATSGTFDVRSAADLAQAAETLATCDVDLILLDLHLPDSQGLDTVANAKSITPGVPIVVLTGLDDADIGQAALQHGAQDYLVKGTLSTDALSRSIRYAIERHRIGEEVLQLNKQLEERVKARTAELRNTVVRLRDEIAERRRAEQALAGEKERLAITLHSLRDAVIAANVSGQIVMMNEAAEALTGCPEADAAGHGMEDVLPLMDDADSTNTIDPVSAILCRAERELQIPAARLVNRHGDERTVSGSCSVVGLPDGECLGVVVVLRDITEERKREEQIQRADKLESLGLMAGGIAHDFNNYLTGIVGNLSLVRVCVEPGTDVYEMVVDAERACQHAQGLTAQLLTFAKGGAPIRDVHDVRTVVAEAASFAASGLKAACRCRLAHDLWSACVDAGQMTQVISNLLINADQAMPSGGTVEIRGENVVLEGNGDLPLAPGRYVAISIKDTGVGISRRYLKRIFEPYFTTKARGSGLGLASAYSIVLKHGGHMAVESETGKGSIFRIYLPAVDGDAGRASPTDESVTAGEGRVLVMDDEPGVRRVAERLLTRLGYTVDVACSGEEAVEAFEKAIIAGQPYEAVILDLTVRGGMDGDEALQKLREIDPGVQAIVSSGYSDSAVMSRYEDYGFVAAVAKPWKAAQLSAAVATVRARRAPIGRQEGARKQQ